MPSSAHTPRPEHAWHCGLSGSGPTMNCPISPVAGSTMSIRTRRLHTSGGSNCAHVPAGCSSRAGVPASGMVMFTGTEISSPVLRSVMTIF